MNPEIPIHGGNLNEEARRLGITPAELIDASASLVPFPASESLHSCLKKAISSNIYKGYPDRTYRDLREALAKWHGIDPETVLPGNGAAELITWAARDAANEGINYLPAPGFGDYARALRCWGASFKYLPLPLSWSPEAPQAFPVIPQGDVIWITNPHNPTGQLWSKKSLEPLLKSQKLVICDEAFLPLVPNGEKQSLLHLAKENSNLIVLRSLTKLFSIAGLRIGYAISTESRLKRWQECRDPWPVNSLANTAGITLISNHKKLSRWLKKVHSWIAKEGYWMQSKLLQFPGIKAHPSAVNFLLIEGEESLINLREELSQKKILLRDCRSFHELDDRWLRISFKKRSENKLIIKSIKELLR